MSSIVDGESTQLGSRRHTVATATPTARGGEIVVMAHHKDQFNMSSIVDGESTQLGSRRHTVATARGGETVVMAHHKDQFNMSSMVDGESTQLESRRHTAATATPTARGDSTVVIDVPENETVDDVIQVAEYWTRQISEVQVNYNNHGDYIYKTFTISVGFLGVIVSAMLSCARQIKESVGCDGWWNRLILSALLLSTLVSSATIVIVIFEFVQQFKLLELERQYQQERNSVLDNCLQDGRLTRSRRFVVSNYRRGFAVSGHPTDSSYWWLLRCALMLIFFVSSACIFVTWAHLRCPSHFHFV